MVAYTHYYSSAVDSRADYCCKYRPGAIYIYIVLMKDLVKKKESILAIVLVGLLLYFITKKLPILYVAFTIGILGLASSAFAGFVHKWWGMLTGVIGKINNIVFLTLIYWVVLTPVAFLMRLLGKSGVTLKKPVGSNFKIRDHLFTKNDLNNPW